MYKLEIAVKSVAGYCSAGHQEGDIFSIEDPVLKLGNTNGVCLYALSALMPYLVSAYRNTAKDDWINEVTHLQCPDKANTVVFELKRIQA